MSIRGTIADMERLLRPREVAALLGVSLKYLQRMRANGTGPVFVRISEKVVRYRSSDYEEWMAAQRAEKES